MTHQEIAAEIEALNNEMAARRKVIDTETRVRRLAIMEKCGTVGHIFIWSMHFSSMGGERDNYTCAVCGAWRPEAMKAAA